VCVCVCVVCVCVCVCVCGVYVCVCVKCTELIGILYEVGKNALCENTLVGVVVCPSVCPSISL
jgi:hypothetical protein